ncbi:hypothetical protein WKR88_25590 [Trinickia caryophylli]|uniref:Uncharacterized protein n=2 Tax=Trinickia caryophylli TaxID=28094 RepID=A0A1X7H6M8_TRICW|nr:hypothetical protein [Trinickia caryophylli]PMS13330.1 hypothetical protein C0Z17_05995 [Trinickia caryophylli]TRX19143.1 hypothetical protein FNF07_13475 [Trinickia caryophylli]WQE13561.1 hypothetical protein U0034_09455 [Trinickia caryophylli]SMF80564.1 hypothetical protein SAMN06295900_12265 [Trinickia caryophylli]
MQRTFQHSFVPPAADPVGTPHVSLSVTEIEDAGVREILQSPGPALACWSFIDALLEPMGPGTPFVFREPLGQAREVKVALSGLFGRFVARAYLERYMGLSIFAHLGQRNIALNARQRISVARIARGDLPDWVACTSRLSNLTVAEAKGCHDRPGPGKALRRAWIQAGRVNVVCGGRPATVKRIAIATRWGAANGGARDPMISVHDPEEPGLPLSPEDERAMFVGLLRRHAAALLRSLGHVELANSLLNLAVTRRSERQLIAEAHQALDAATVWGVDAEQGANWVDDLIGGVVTRQGPIAERRLSPPDEQTLARLNLRPLFVGLERKVVRSAIDGDGDVLEKILSTDREQVRARFDGSGGWILPLGQ